MNINDSLVDQVIRNIAGQLKVEPRASVVKMFYLEGEEEASIARNLGLPLSAVANLLQNFKALLANMLIDDLVMENEGQLNDKNIFSENDF